MSIGESERDILRIYLATTQQGTMNNLRAAYNYSRLKNQGELFYKLLHIIELMDESEFSTLAKQILSP